MFSLMGKRDYYKFSVIMHTESNMQNEVGLGVWRRMEDVILELSFKKDKKEVGR